MVFGAKCLCKWAETATKPSGAVVRSLEYPLYVLLAFGQCSGRVDTESCARAPHLSKLMAIARSIHKSSTCSRDHLQPR